MAATRCIWTAALLLGAAAVAAAAGLPADVSAALQRAKVPPDALAVVVREVSPGSRTLLASEADRPVNPASLTKLLTTYAALDRLGPAYTWTTPVWVQGSLRDGVLDGSVAIRGSGDPKFGIERLWLLLRRLRQLGVNEIRGDIVLDNSAFAVEPGSAADFDGDATRPYNVRAEALLFNHKAVRLSFVPDPGAGIARVLAEPALPAAATVPLRSGACGAWLATLAPAFGSDGRLSFGGGYPVLCGEREWWVADPQPASYNARLVASLWAEAGGVLKGSVRDGAAPQPTQTPTFELRSPPLAEVVRDVNKFSNNLMAQQIFYTLDPARPATAAGAREALRGWIADKLGPLPPGTVIDNGSGLSRETRISAATLARLLVLAWDGPLMPELMASLPIASIDGTLQRRSHGPAAGRAHLKTGSLRDVTAIAGYVLADSGRRYALVAIVQHPNAAAARPALDALLQWTLRDGP